MTRRRKLIFAGGVIAHAIISWVSAAWCAGVSLAILDSGGKDAPVSLSVMCLVHAITRYPLAPLTRHTLKGTVPVQPAYWPPLIINSLITVLLIFLFIRGARKLLGSDQGRIAH